MEFPGVRRLNERTHEAISYQLAYVVFLYIVVGLTFTLDVLCCNVMT